MAPRHPIALVALAAALLVAGVACSDDAEPASWDQVVAPPQCACSDGSPYHFWIRRADPERVVFFLEGGGACFSADTCGPTSPTFTRNLAGSADATAGGPADAGIFDLSDDRNPFADWSFVFVPYCTGDLHLGDATHDYGDGVVVRHNGAVNASTALAATAAAFPDAREVVVAGSSAGSAGAPMYAGITHDLLPDATVTLLADGSGAYPDDDGITTAIGTLWGAFEDLPDWPEQTGPPPAHWTLPRLLVQAGRHVPELRVATLNNAYDEAQVRFSALIGHPGDLLSMIESNNELVEDEGVEVRSWVGPGTEHTVLGRDAFYDDVVDGTALHEWVTDVVDGEDVDGEDVDDVRCTECR